MQNKDFLVVVDVQPNYYQGCYEILPDVLEKMNECNKPIIFFYVGRTLDGDSKEDVIGFLLENGLQEHVLDQIRFVEKEYGYFRSWMDNRVDHNFIVDAVKMMSANQIQNSKTFTDSQWQQLTNGKKDKLHILYGENIYLPQINPKLFAKVDNLELIGGGRHECLEEMNLYLKSLGKTTFINESLCYGADCFNPHKKTKNRR